MNIPSNPLCSKIHKRHCWHAKNTKLVQCCRCDAVISIKNIPAEEAEQDHYSERKVNG